MWMGAKYGMSKDATRFAGAVGRGALVRKSAGRIRKELGCNGGNWSWMLKFMPL